MHRRAVWPIRFSNVEARWNKYRTRPGHPNDSDRPAKFSVWAPPCTGAAHGCVGDHIPTPPPGAASANGGGAQPMAFTLGGEAVSAALGPAQLSDRQPSCKRTPFAATLRTWLTHVAPRVIFCRGGASLNPCGIKCLYSVCRKPASAIAAAQLHILHLDCCRGPAPASQALRRAVTPAPTELPSQPILLAVPADIWSTQSFPSIQAAAICGSNKPASPGCVPLSVLFAPGGTGEGPALALKVPSQIAPGRVTHRHPSG